MSKATGDRGSVRISGFGLLSDFVIRISSVSSASSRRLPPNYERFEIRLPPVAEEPRLHRRGRAHARAWHWGHHCNLNRGQRGLVTLLALRGIRSAGLVARTQPELSDYVSLLPELHRLAGAADGLRADRRL